MAQATEETRIYAIASGLEDYYNQCSYPTDLLASDKFQEGIALLCSNSFSADDLLNYYRGTNFLVSCMALEALARRSSDSVDLVEPILWSINSAHWWVRYYALRALNARVQRDIITTVLLQLDSSWSDYTLLSYLREFTEKRLAHGENPVWGSRLEDLTESQVSTLGDLLSNIVLSLPDALIEDFNNWRGDTVDESFLNSFGRVWARSERADDSSVIMLEPVANKVAELETALRKETPRSVMVVGDSGVGKTSLIKVLARRLQKQRWIIFEASATDIMAGQKYTGELEGRVHSLVRQITGKRVLWIVPHFQELLWAGRHTQSPVGVLDMLLPYIERGDIKLIGETSSRAYEKLLILKPKLRTALESCRVEPLSDKETLELARQWVDRKDAKGGASVINDQTLQEAFQLARQFLADKAAPGNLLHLLELTHQRLTTGKASPGKQISLDDLLVTLSQLTGLPASILDDRAALDLSDLRKFFAERVLGQPEAVECLIERVAMIKAGLTDPTRPSGVFLFVGPTGTGKTEIAKTLAAFLFGSPDRMIRLDMSELKTADSVDRILGESGELSESAALVNAIRKQPFSVVLLDEFEKAASGIWDLFLQVFDDGRLTDRRGNTADFRHSIIIMTSNLGATLPHGASIGFTQVIRDQEQFASLSVERAVAQSFRREFVNRIDRIVVFRPLGWSVMRELLQKELKDVLLRRGFRNRQWAVEWDESAIEFLLQKGFTADLGARPLKRAIERYLLSPLAMTIVNHQFPEGDQFLFVRARDEQIVVEFIDPDALDKRDEEATEPLQADAPAAQEDFGDLQLKEIVLEGRGTMAEVAFLQNAYEQLAERVGNEEWHERKTRALLQTTRPDFWDSPERFSVLGLAEYMDRIEAGLETAGSLLQRISRTLSQPAGHKQFPHKLVQRVAQHLYLLDAACTGLAQSQPRDAFISVKATRDTVADREFGDAFAGRLAKMYRLWAEKRGMRVDILEETCGDAVTPSQHLLAVSGFAAYSILQQESGLHVLEMIEDGKQFNRIKVHVRVAPQPDEPPVHGEGARAQAVHTFLAHDAEAHKTTRSYREQPSPLVRDRLRHWRTGKIERVLGGDFDLIA
ncbi:MAG: AAA family ATPase [Pyrinomonadaceae bacterium]